MSNTTKNTFKLYKRNQRNQIQVAEYKVRKERKEEAYSIFELKYVESDVNVDKKSNKIFTNVREKVDKKIQSLIKSLKQDGYKDTKPNLTEDKALSFADNTLKPMLLNKIDLSDQAKVSQMLPVYMQNKYDGVRCIAEKVMINGKTEIRLKSREGNVFNLPHILALVKDIFTDYNIDMLDGELYNHNMLLHDIITTVKANDTKQLLSYVIYDIPSKLPFENRRNMLVDLACEPRNFMIVDSGKECNTYDEVKEFYRQSLENNFEGSIMCMPDSKYDFGYRTNSKMKIKPRETKEFMCIDHYFNKGKMKDQSTLICITEEGREFHVKMKGTSEERVQMAKDFEQKFKNKPVTVEYRKLSKYNVPIEAVGISVRDYE